MKRRIGAVLLLAVMLVLQGCGQSDTGKTTGDLSNLNLTGFPIVKTPITVSGFGRKSPVHSEWDDMQFFKKYSEMTGISFDWTLIPDTAWTERKNIAFASNEYPEIFMRAMLLTSEEVNYGSQGIIVPLNDLIDKYAPNIKAVFKAYPDVEKAITAPDGNIYSLPQVVDYMLPRLNNKLWINKKWLDALNLPMPTTTDEYYDVLTAFRDNDPNGNGQKDEIGWSGDKNFSIFQGLMGSFGLGRGAYRPGYMDIGENDKMYFYGTSDNYKKYLMYLSKLYSEGLVDQEVFTMAQPQVIAKAGKNQIGSLNLSSISIIGETYAKDYAVAPAMKGPDGHRIYASVLPVTQVQGTFAITDKCQNPEAVIRWVDYLYSEEGCKFLRMGTEGETFTVDSQGNLSYVDSILNNQEGLSIDQAVGRFTFWPGGGVPQMIYEKYDKTNNVVYTQDAPAMAMPYLPKTILSNFMFTREEQEILNVIQADIYSYATEMKTGFIIGKTSFDKWDEYVARFSSMKVDELERIYNAAYERYKNR